MAQGSNTGSGRKPAQASARPKSSVRDKATAAASAAQPELAPLLQGANAAHNKIFGGKGRLTSSNSSRLLLVEFLVCMVILGAGTIVAPQGSKDGVPRLMTRGTGLSLLFFVLALTAGGGPKVKKAAEALGGLVTVSYLVLSSDALNIFKWMISFFGTGAEAAGADLGDLGATVADTGATAVSTGAPTVAGTSGGGGPSSAAAQ